MRRRLRQRATGSEPNVFWYTAPTRQLGSKLLQDAACSDAIDLRRFVRGERGYLDLAEGLRDPKSGQVWQRVLGYRGREEQVRLHLPALIQTVQKLSAAPPLNPSSMAPGSTLDYGGVWLSGNSGRSWGWTGATDRETAVRCFALLGTTSAGSRSRSGPVPGPPPERWPWPRPRATPSLPGYPSPRQPDPAQPRPTSML